MIEADAFEPVPAPTEPLPDDEEATVVAVSAWWDSDEAEALYRRGVTGR